MEKFYLESKEDLKKVIEKYTNNDYGIEDFDLEVNTYPCVLVCSFSDDIEFGDYYQFTSVSLNHFQKKSNIIYN